MGGGASTSPGTGGGGPPGRPQRTSNCQWAACSSCFAWSAAQPAASTNWLIMTWCRSSSIFTDMASETKPQQGREEESQTHSPGPGRYACACLGEGKKIHKGILLRFHPETPTAFLGRRGFRLAPPIGLSQVDRLGLLSFFNPRGQGYVDIPPSPRVAPRQPNTPQTTASRGGACGETGSGQGGSRRCLNAQVYASGARWLAARVFSESMNVRFESSRRWMFLFFLPTPFFSIAQTSLGGISHRALFLLVRGYVLAEQKARHWCISSRKGGVKRCSCLNWKFSPRRWLAALLPLPLFFPPVLEKKVSFVKAKFIDELRCNQHAQLEKQEGAAVNHFRWKGWSSWKLNLSPHTNILQYI